MSSGSGQGSKKRKVDQMLTDLELNDSQSSDISMCSPPTLSQRSDGHLSTPQKTKLDFDFWAKDEPVVKQYRTSAGDEWKISELQAGQYVNDAVVFRVVLKSLPKETKNGFMLIFHGIDESAEIAMTVFPKEFEKFNEAIQLNGIYRLENFVVGEESKEYASGSGNHLRVMLNESSILEKRDQLHDFQKIPFNFVFIQDLKELAAKSRADVLGILVKVWEKETISTGKWKREIAITDHSKSTIMVTLWGSAAEQFSAEIHSVIAIRKGSVSEFLQKKSLTCLAGTLVWVDPIVEEAAVLKEWFVSELKRK